MAWYFLRYTCPDCAVSWDDEWSCACDDSCPACGARNISPVHAADISVILRRTEDGKRVVSISRREADDDPAYVDMALDQVLRMAAGIGSSAA